MGGCMKCSWFRDNEEPRAIKYEYIGTCCKGQVIYRVSYSDGTRFDQKCCTCDGPGKAIPKKSKWSRGCAKCWAKCDKQFNCKDCILWYCCTHRKRKHKKVKTTN